MKTISQWSDYWIDSRLSRRMAENVRSNLYSRFIVRYLNKFMKEETQFLEAGCGSASFEKFVKGRYHGVDWSPAALEISKKKVRHPERISKGDLTNMDFTDKSFDLLVSQGILEYQKDWGPFLKEFSRVTKQRIFIIFPDKRSAPGLLNLIKPKKKDKEFSRIYLTDKEILARSGNNLHRPIIRSILTPIGFAKMLISRPVEPKSEKNKSLPGNKRIKISQGIGGEK